MLLVLGGCVGMPALDVILVSVAPVEATLLEQRLRLTLRVVNASDDVLRATGMDVTFKVNDRRLARGVDDQSFLLTGLSDAEVDVIVSTTLFDVARQLLAVPDREAFSYELSGRLHVDGWRRGASFTHRGEISRQQLRRLAGAGGLEPQPLELQP